MRSFTIDGAGFYDNPAWSPDSSKIAFASSWSLYWLDVESGSVTKMAEEPSSDP